MVVKLQVVLDDFTPSNTEFDLKNKKVGYMGGECEVDDHTHEIGFANVVTCPDMRLNMISSGLPSDEDGYHKQFWLKACESDSRIIDCCKREKGIQRAWNSASKDSTKGRHAIEWLVAQSGMNSPWLYDPVQKKLVRSRDVEFDKDQTLKDVEKTENETIPQHNDDLIDLDPVPPKHFDAQFGDDIQNDEEQNDEEHGADDVDAQEQPNLDEDVHPELPVDYATICSVRRVTRDHHPSTRYSSNEYVFLMMGEIPKCYAEVYGR
ncbi:hypothetical protein Tco_0128149 [Tanacetum coccineum]